MFSQMPIVIAACAVVGVIISSAINLAKLALSNKNADGIYAERTFASVATSILISGLIIGAGLWLLCLIFGLISAFVFVA